MFYKNLIIGKNFLAVLNQNNQQIELDFHAASMQFTSKIHESNHQKHSIKKAVLKNFAIFTGKNPCCSLFFSKKEIPTQVFSCEYCDIFQNIYFEEFMRTAASEYDIIIFRSPSLEKR